MVVELPRVKTIRSNVFAMMTCMNYCPFMLICKGQMPIRELRWVLRSERV